METDEICRVMRVFPQFDNVYSIDTLPPYLNGLLVCNLHPSYRPGCHWVAIYIDGDHGGGGYGESSAGCHTKLPESVVWCKQMDF